MIEAMRVMGANCSIQCMINAIEEKDLYTQGHSHHVFVVADAIFDALPAERRAEIEKQKLLDAALLHDIGKILTPDAILNKDGSLSDSEWEIMRRHPRDGWELLQGTAYEELSEWILYHHERMDGRGYYGLKGEQLSVYSRVIAIADTFSALRTYRIYRPAKTIGETVRILRECAGAQLDEEILACFLSLGEDFLETLECGCEICKQRRKELEQRLKDAS